MFPRFPRAWLVALTAGVLLAAGVALSAHGSAPDTGYLLLDLCVGLSCAVVAGLVLSRRPGHVVGRLLAVAGLGLAMQAAAGGYAVAAHQGGWPAQSLAFWLTKWVFFVGLAPLLLLPMVLPDGRLPSPAWRPVLALLVALSAVLTVLLMLRDQAWAWGVDVPSPLGNLSTDRVVAPAFGVVMVTFAAADAAAVLSRLRGGPEVQRRQMYPLLAAALAVAAALVVDTVLHDSGVGLWRVALSLTLLPVSVAFCVFRYRLFEIEVGIRRTLVYAVVSVALLLVYLGIVAVLDIPLFAAAVVAVAFAPVRDLVQRWLSHLLFGDRGDPSTALSALGRRLADSTDTPLDAAAPAVAVTLRLPAAAVVDDAGAVLSEYGSAPLDDAVFLLVNAGRTEGELRVAGRPRTSRSRRPTVRCSPSSRGRWPRRWQPRAWTVKCAGPGRTWSPLARRSGAGCAGNCTTAWGRAWPPSAWSSISLGPCTPRRLRTEAGRRRLGPVPSRARCWVRCAGSCTNCGLRRWTNWAWWVRSRTSR